MGTRGITPEQCKYMQIINRGRIRVYRMHFPSIGALHLFLTENPDRNREVFPEARSETAAVEFAGPPLTKAIDFCIGGYEERYAQFLEFARQLEAINNRFSHNRKIEKSFVGQRPNVPAYIAGAPKTMYRTTRAEGKKTINVFMNIAYSSKITLEQIRNRGIITLNLIRILEANGYIVNFRLFEACYMKEEIFVGEVLLKKPGEALDTRLCYYPMCGVGFVRRVMARVKESMPFTANWGLSYGMLLSESQVREELGVTEKDIYIGSPTEMNVKGENIYEDADAFLEKLQLGEEIVIPKYRIPQME